MAIHRYTRLLTSNKMPDAIGLVLLILAILVTISIGSAREQEFDEQQASLASSATRILKNSIEAELREKMRITRVFFTNNSTLFEQLIKTPDDEALFTEINDKLGRYFPDYYAFNIVNDEGAPVVDDFDGSLGELCLSDVTHFITSQHTHIRLHPHPVLYHFDVPVELIHEGRHYTAMVSFDFGRLAMLIRDAQPADHKLMLVQKEMDNLIEVTEAGARDQLSERDDYRMRPDETARVLAEEAIEGTNWHAVGLHEPYLLRDYHFMNRQHTATLLAALLLLVSLIWYALKRYYRHLAQANTRLAKKNHSISARNRTLLRNSITDALTGLQNRRYFDDSIKLQWSMSQRNRQALTLLFIDVDHFKLYNDSYGHQEGDECLRKIAEVMSRIYTRSVDTVARYGGEEFVIVTTNSSYQEAVQRAQNLCDEVRNLNIQHSNSPVSRYVTISCGVVHIVPSSDIRLEELVRRADNALYEAKNSGRNRVISYDYTNSEQIRSRDELQFDISSDDEPPASSGAAR